MTLPSWQDRKKYGGMVRAALWLETEVGEGKIFTKARLREAFPDDQQIDRRVRDLRDRGWRIDTSRDDPSLKQEEQRYVHKGAEVWLPGQNKGPAHKNSLTAAQRNKVMLADNLLCRTCGVGAGESYGDGIETSKLNVSRRKVRLADGTVEVQLVTECQRCSAGSVDREAGLDELLTAVSALTELERKVLSGWIEADRRTLSALEKLWGFYRTMPAASREAVAKAVNAEGK
ncbi:hypothetical protein [Kitasatospora sp. NPDC056531]|uniref:hypothetical protein n=1 Tax=Kitasatospora sp. NPDC056531 TaxID=3345856 RepID=UPI00367F0E59